MNNVTQVLIVGAGPTGLSSAIMLKMHGIDVKIIDVQPDGPVDTTIAKAITLNSRAFEVLDAMGITDAFLKKSIICREIQWIKTPDSANSMDFKPLDRFHTDYPFLIHLPQWQMNIIFAEKLKELGVTIEKSVEFLNLEQTNDKVIATLSKDNKQYVVEAQYLLGCDGTKSKVRGCIGADLQLSAEGFITFHQVDAKITHFNKDKSKRYTYLLEKNTFTILPIMDDYQRLIIASASDGTQNITENSFNEKLKEIGCSESVIEDPLWFTELSPKSQLCDKYQEGRVFVLGDAAHPISPLTGQGVNTGLQDVYNLCWKLIIVLKKNAPATILLSYGQERHLLGKYLADRANKMTTLLYTLFSEKRENNFIVGLLKKLKKKIIRTLFNKNKMMKNYIIEQSQLNLSYEQNDIIVPSTIKNLSLQPGARMPNIALSKNSHINALYSLIPYDYFLLLIYVNQKNLHKIAEMQKQIEQLLTEYKHFVKPLIVLESSHLASEYVDKNPHSENLMIDKSNIFEKDQSYYVLIRPDTYIAMSELLDNFSPLDDYLKKFISDK